MIKPFFLISILILSLNSQAQRIPRPGGGGEDSWREELDVSKTLSLLNSRIQECDLKEKKKVNLDQMYDLLFKLHFKIQINGSAGSYQDGYGCKGYDYELTCIMNNKFKKNLDQITNDKRLPSYWLKNSSKDLDKEEVEAKINFLKHLVQGSHKGEGKSER